MLDVNCSIDANERQSQNLAAALAAAGARMRVFPVRVLAKPGGRKAVQPLVAWKEAASADPQKVRQWWRQYPDAVPGIATGEVFVIDLDTGNGKDGEAAFRALGCKPEEALFAVRTPSGGRHLYYDRAAGLTISGSRIAPGIDTRGEGGFVFAPGAVTFAGEYRIEVGDMTDLQFGMLSPVPRPVLAALERPAAEPAGQPEPGGADIATLRQALACIPNDGSREEWVRILMALHHGTGGDAHGRALAHGWSAGYSGFDPREVDSIWRSFGKRQDGALVTVETLFAEARAHGWQAIGDDLLDDLEAEDQPPKSAAEDSEVLALLGEEAPAPAPDKDGLIFLTPDQCAAAASRRYLVKGLIAEGDVGCLVGAPGAGKSVFAPALAYAVAQGREFHGRRVRKGPVFYVAAEDEHGMRGRISALRSTHGEAPGLKLVAGVSDLLNPEAGKRWSKHALALARAVKRDRPSLVVIDTLAMAFPGLEENSAEGMGKVVAVARALTKWGAAVLLVHHDTKDGAQGLPRGHSLLNGALDMSLHIGRKESGLIAGRLTKNRNGPVDLDLAFKVESVEIGRDEDGDPVSVPLHRECAAEQESGPRLTAPQRAALAHLHELLTPGRDAIPESEWRAACTSGRTVSASELPDTRRKAFRRAAADLIEAGVIVSASGCYRLPDRFGGLLDDLDD